MPNQTNNQNPRLRGTAEPSPGRRAEGKKEKRAEALRQNLQRRKRAEVNSTGSEAQAPK